MKQPLVKLVLVATASLHLVNATSTISNAYLFELEDGTDVEEFASTVKADFKAGIRRVLDYPIFKGLSVEFADESRVNEVAALPRIRKMWEVEELHMQDGVDAKDISPLDDQPQGKHDEQPIRRSLHDGALLERRAVSNKTVMGPNAHHVSMQIDQLHKKGITGKGSKIAVIDTGVDYTHPALGGCFGPGCVISFGADLVKGEATPMDCSSNGRGTFVTGLIVARSDRFNYVGAAPGAEVGMYRITCNKTFSNDVLIDALYRAHRDGATIISTSFSNPGGGAAGLLTEAASRLTAQGVVVVQSVDENGESGLFSVPEPSGMPGIITVGMVTSPVSPGVYSKATWLADGGGEETSFPVFRNHAHDNFTGEPMELYAVQGNLVPDDAPDLSNKLVLMCVSGGWKAWRDGEWDAQLAPFAAKGAQRVLFYAERMSANADSLKNPPSNIKAVAMITREDGRSLLEAFKTGTKMLVTVFPGADMTAPLHYAEYPALPGPNISFTSSWGPSWDLGIQPSLVAIGGQVLSTCPLKRSRLGFVSRSKPSSAAALVASVVALVAEARGPLDPAKMQNLLMSNSEPQTKFTAKFYRPKPEKPYFEPVAHQGAGLVRAYDAAFSTSLLELETTGLNFNDTEHFVPSLEFTLKNMGNDDVKYQLSHIPAKTVHTYDAYGKNPLKPDNSLSAGWNFPDFAEPTASIDLSERSLTLRSKNSATIRVTATAPEGLDFRRLGAWSGWIAVKGSDGSSLSIPYQGFTGSIRQHRVMEAHGLWLAYRYRKDGFLNVRYCNQTVLILPPPGSKEKARIMFYIKTTLGSPLVHVDVVPVRSGNGTGEASIGEVFGFPKKNFPSYHTDIDDGIHRFITTEWTGLLDTGSYVPEGRYMLVVRALRIFGDPDKEDDWDVSKSPELSISYGSTDPPLTPKCRQQYE
ncbi:hypothetical protein L249_7991 [Ophiocordyceps polyrhachis-furcata BCC 54312]|uniref:Subtilisin-like protease n=1 Tax=Ophiocordyceps polyrhachis-furcata BCC 54312 TaxID=1330021 RepID=A0A367LHY1_9HYPO|nr:hypothetical protein L249_7991 [Ophiocordyceps polyrhachis-furcata BCC 54312]